MPASVHHLRSFRPPTGGAAVVAVLDEMVGMLERHGLAVWAGELGEATRALRDGHAEGRTRVRVLLHDPDGLRIVRVGFGTPAAITRWVSLCDRLGELLDPDGVTERRAPVLPIRRQA